jgi:hypothetical protein
VANRLGSVRPLVSGRSAAPVHGRGRGCEEKGCDTVLSVYNATSFCSVHERGAQAPGRKPHDAHDRVTMTCALTTCGRSFESVNLTRVYCSAHCRMLGFSLRTSETAELVAPGVA